MKALDGKNGTIPGNYHVTTKWRMKGISHS